MKNIFAFIVLAVITTGRAAAGTLQIDPAQSSVVVAVHATMDSFVGQLSKFEAKVDCDSTNDRPSKADVSFDLADLKTGKKDRDEAMLKWFEYAGHPNGSYRLTGWKQESETAVAMGELNLHGVTLPVEIPVVIQHKGDVWDLRGTAEFDHRDFNLPKIRKALVMTVDPKLKVSFHLVGTLPVSH